MQETEALGRKQHTEFSVLKWSMSCSAHVQWNKHWLSTPLKNKFSKLEAHWSWTNTKIKKKIKDQQQKKACLPFDKIKKKTQKHKHTIPKSWVSRNSIILLAKTCIDHMNGSEKQTQQLFVRSKSSQKMFAVKTPLEWRNY